MRRYWTLAMLVASLIITVFLLADAANVPILGDPRPRMNQGGAVAAATGFGLLVTDVILPIPSSLVMLTHGALFGPWVGTLLSLAGSVGAAAVGFAIGRAGGPLLTRFVPPDEQMSADQLLVRWGALALVVTRPVPILAETTAILAGASPLSWSRALTAVAVGSLVPAALYAVVGAMAVDFASGTLVFFAVLLMTGVFWWVGRRRRAVTVRGPVE